MSAITSTTNATIKHIRGLRQRKYRDAEGVFYAEGIRTAGEAAATMADVEQVVIAPELLSSAYAHGVAETLAADGAQFIEVSADVFRHLSTRDGPQGIAVVARQRWIDLDALEPGNGLCRVVLDSTQDPGNLGSILRTCDAVGASGIVVVGDGADPYDPVAVRAGMGAIFSQPCTRASWPEICRWKAEYRAAFVGTSDAAEFEYRTFRFPQPLFLVMGSERAGLHSEGVDVCDAMVRIPMRGRGDSLNLAVATGIVLYEVLYQQQSTRVLE